jgi:hypothetical protein
MKPMNNDHSLMNPRDGGCYAIVPESHVTARIQVGENAASRLLNGNIRVLSRSQLRLTITENLPPNTSVELAVDVNSMGVVFSSMATVSWTQVRGDGRFWMSCELEDQIPESLLEKLAVQGHLDRRDVSRVHLSQSVTVSRELGKGTVNAKIANLSPNGCCLLMAGSVQKNERLLLEINQEQDSRDPVSALVKWHRPNGEDNLVGCLFLGTDGYKRLEDCLPKQRSNNRSATFTWKLVAAALVSGLLTTFAYTQLLK